MIKAIIAEISQDWVSARSDMEKAMYISFGCIWEAKKSLCFNCGHPSELMLMWWLCSIGGSKGRLATSSIAFLWIYNSSLILERLWIACLLNWHLTKEGWDLGWLFAKEDGTRKIFHDFDPQLLHHLEQVFIRDPTLFRNRWRAVISGCGGQPGAVSTLRLWIEVLTLHQSKLVGWWQMKEAAQGTNPSLPIR